MSWTRSRLSGSRAAASAGLPLPVGERWSLPMRCSATSRPFCPGLGREIDRALAADIIEMRVEEVARRPPSTVAQHHEELVIRVQLAVGRELAERVVERDAVQLDAAVLAGPGAVRQPAFVDQAGDELDRAQLADQRGIEGDLVDAVHDLLRGGRRHPPLD